MQVIALRALRLSWEKHPRAEVSLKVWHATVSKAEWTGPADVRAMFNSTEFMADSRVIFNVGEGRYRLVAHVAYPYKRVLIKLVGTHAEYDKIDPEMV